MKRKEIAKRIKKIAKKLEKNFDNWCLERGKEGADQREVDMNVFKMSITHDDLQELYCELKGHDFANDHCGFWQHQLCYRCGRPKYPELSSKSCKDLQKEMGDMTEERYIAANSYEQTK